MKALVIVSNPKEGSFCHALAAAAIDELRSLGHEVVYHDLDREGLDPILTAPEVSREGPVPARIQQHCADLVQADGIVIVHPNWWGMPPAILKGWVDRVIRPGVAYEFAEGDGGEGVPVGLLRAQVALVLNTTDTDPEREQVVFGDPLELIWKRCIFGLCGVPNIHRRSYGIIVTSSREQRQAWLVDVRGLVRELFG
jgi:NAD(P)H dehydrogenase (quinone)